MEFLFKTQKGKLDGRAPKLMTTWHFAINCLNLTTGLTFKSNGKRKILRDKISTY